MIDPAGVHVLVSDDWGLFARPFIGQLGIGRVITTPNEETALKKAWQFVRQFDPSVTIRKSTIVTESGTLRVFPVGTIDLQGATTAYLIAWREQDTVWTERKMPVVVSAPSSAEALNDFAYTAKFLNRYPKWEKDRWYEYRISPLIKYELLALPVEVIS